MSAKCKLRKPFVDNAASGSVTVQTGETGREKLENALLALERELVEIVDEMRLETQVTLEQAA